jgi:uncharacterized protein YegJ (DUF2314 family)
MVLVAALVLGGCAQRRGALVEAAEVRPPVRAGSPFAEVTTFQLAIFHSRPELPVETRLPRLRAQHAPALRRASDIAEGQPPPWVRVEVIPAASYILPPEEMLEQAVRTLSPQEQSALASAGHVIHLEVSTAAPRLEEVRQAYALALALAQAWDGIILDTQAAQFFGPEAWKAQRLGGWEQGTPLLEQHFNSLLYEEDEEHSRFSTVGLEKFGLPELEVARIPNSEVERVGTLLNVVAQLMLEGTPVGEGGHFPVSFEAVRHPGLRERLQASLGEGARQRLLLGLTVAYAGTPGRRFELVFPGGAGGSDTEHLHAAMVELFGARDEMVRTRHDEELLATSRRAVEKLLSEVKPRFVRGLEPGERLFVKAPFKTRSGDDEWMWVRVQRWDGPKLHGVLDSDPRDVPDIGAGSPVVVEESTLFDYLLVHPDGSSEGNETQEIILRGRGGSL